MAKTPKQAPAVEEDDSLLSAFSSIVNSVGDMLLEPIEEVTKEVQKEAPTKEVKDAPPTRDNANSGSAERSQTINLNLNSLFRRQQNRTKRTTAPAKEEGTPVREQEPSDESDESDD